MQRHIWILKAMQKTIITWQQIYERIEQMRACNHGKTFYGIPRGGSIIAGLLGNAVDDPRHADIIVDDILDSGQTYRKWKAKFPLKKFIVAFNRNEFGNGAWVEFPWEVHETVVERNEQINRLAIMMDVNRALAVQKIENLIKQMENE
jgi:hypothetical protein